MVGRDKPLSNWGLALGPFSGALAGSFREDKSFMTAMTSARAEPFVHGPLEGPMGGA